MIPRDAKPKTGAQLRAEIEQSERRAWRNLMIAVGVFAIFLAVALLLLGAF